MSATTRTVQPTLGTRQLGAALFAVALAIVLAVALALSQSAATKSQTAPAVGSAPVFIDHGSRDEIGPGAAITAAPVTSAPSQRGYMSAAAAAAATTGQVSKDHKIHAHRRTDSVGSSESTRGRIGGQ